MSDMQNSFDAAVLLGKGPFYLLGMTTLWRIIFCICSDPCLRTDKNIYKIRLWLFLDYLYA